MDSMCGIINTLSNSVRFNLSPYFSPSETLWIAKHNVRQTDGLNYLEGVMERISGVYEIYNTSNGHRYIGSSVDIHKRWRQHTVDARRNAHHSIYLQRAWNKYGEEAFEFRLLLICDPEYLMYYEESMIINLHPEYNMGQHAISSLGYKHTEEAKRRISEGQRGKHRNVSEETKHKISNTLLGHSVPLYTRIKLSVSCSGITHTEETKELCRQLSLSHWSKPESYSHFTFSENDIRIIRWIHNTYHYSYGYIGSLYGVVGGTIGAIVTNRTWKWVESSIV